MKKIFTSLLVSFLTISITPVFAQEALKSVEEEYYDFLSLTGVVERPTLGYRTLSDSVWNFNEVESFEENEDGTFTKVRTPGEESSGHIWKSNNLGTTYTLWEPEQQANNWFARGLKQGITARVYGPEWFNSYNTAAPYGQNDGALWQGRGYNTALTTGLRLEGYGFELTFKPQVSWSQNKEFEIMDVSEFYTNKYAYIWGWKVKNKKNIGADAPQRFGDKSFWTFDLADSEVRWTWNTFTVGFGTETIWLGPAWQNPLLHSNNAASYPKFDFGLRKTSIIIPYFGWYLGDIEARMWLGKLTESDFFDDNNTNNHNQITGMTFSYAPSFLPGLTIGINKICLSKWNDNDFYKYLNPAYGMKGAGEGNVGEDQKIGITLDWLVPKGGFDVYAEFGIDDHVNYKDTIDSYITHYWHTFTYTFGIKKEIPIYPHKNIRGEVFFEWNNTEMSQDMQVQWPYNFGFHHIITQGYTNKGQWLGSGIGYGGQSQYLSFKVYYPKGSFLLYINRYNPDNNFLFKEAIYDVSTGESGALHERTWNYYKGILSFGVSTYYFVTSTINIGGSLSYNRIVNPLYNQSKSQYDVCKNVYFSCYGKYSF